MKFISTILFLAVLFSQAFSQELKFYSYLALGMNGIGSKYNTLHFDLTKYDQITQHFNKTMEPAISGELGLGAKLTNNIFFVLEFKTINIKTKERELSDKITGNSFNASIEYLVPLTNYLSLGFSLGAGLNNLEYLRRIEAEYMNLYMDLFNEDLLYYSFIPSLNIKVKLYPEIFVMVKSEYNIIGEKNISIPNSKYFTTNRMTFSIQGSENLYNFSHYNFHIGVLYSPNWF